jgi:hypothetical protein
VTVVVEVHREEVAVQVTAEEESVGAAGARRT